MEINTILYLSALALPYDGDRYYDTVLAVLILHDGDRYDGTVVLEIARYDFHRMMEVDTVLYL